MRRQVPQIVPTTWFVGPSAKLKYGDSFYKKKQGKVLLNVLNIKLASFSYALSTANGNFYFVLFYFLNGF